MKFLRNFRAFNGAVSLKLVIWRWSSSATKANFRAFNGAVSLKQRRCDVIRGVDGLFPRLQRRGLIEAAMALPRSQLPRYFRAFNGAVSLKRIVESANNACLDDFRAFNGAVSLKLLLRGCISNETVDFRAFNGAVSLKPADPDPPLAILRDFRAFNGAVSLKHGAARGTGAAGGGKFPRLQRRGLIEAVPCGGFRSGRADFRAFNGAVSLKQDGVASDNPLIRS